MVPSLRIYLVRSVHLHRSSYYHHGHHCFLEFDQGKLLHHRHQDDDKYLLRSFHRCCCLFDLHHQDNTEHIRLRCKTKNKNDCLNSLSNIFHPYISKPNLPDIILNVYFSCVIEHLTFLKENILFMHY